MRKNPSFKIGDNVTILSLDKLKNRADDNYDDNYNDNELYIDGIYFVSNMISCCGKSFTIDQAFWHEGTDQYIYRLMGKDWSFNDRMFKESLFQKNKDILKNINPILKFTKELL